MIKKSAIALAVALPLLLSSCAGNNTRTMSAGAESEISKVCVLLPDYYNAKATKSMGDLLVKVIADNGYAVETVHGQREAEDKGCSHYMKYSTRAKGEVHKFFHLNFYKIKPNRDKYDRVAEATNRDKLNLKNNYQEAYNTVDSTFKKMLNK